MKLGIMQPYIFPYIGYFQHINSVDNFILYDNVNFIKRKWINRNRFLIVNKEPSYFIIPIKEKSSFKKINEIQLEPGKSWRIKILKQLEYNYKKSPYFNEIFPIVEKVFLLDTRLLFELNNYGIVEICNLLDINTNIITETSIYAEIENKLHYYENDLISGYPYYHLTDFKKNVIRIFEICKVENTNHYINSIGGTSLYDKQEFLNNGLVLNFIKCDDIIYKQNSGTFFPSLSIIDVLMNCGKENTIKMLGSYSIL